MKHLIHHLTKEVRRHGFDYAILIAASLFFLLFLWLFRGYKIYSFVVLVLFTCFYMVWGTYHHTKVKSLHMKNVVEYILIGFTVIYLLKLIISF